MPSESGPRRLRAGIVGGGRGAFIGAVHRIAAELDGQATVVAGALSSNPDTARESAAQWFLDRSYEDFTRMAREESAHPDGIDFVIVATPNHLHLPVAKAFLEAGIHVVCDKPLARTVSETEELAALVERKAPLVFALTHNYTGYPAVRHARELVATGAIGTLRRVIVEYQQDWLMTALEQTGHKQAAWRADPAKSGPGGCIADIGTHAENLLEFVTGRQIAALCADLTTFVPGRALDDDANILLRLEGGAKGVLTCSQIACGEENNLTLRIYGTRAGLEWHQQSPETLTYKPAGHPWQTLRRGHSYMSDASKAATRLPPGHPEGYLEAFASIYSAVIADVRRAQAGEALRGGYPSVRDGVRGVRFIEKAVESSKLGAQWVTL